MSSVVIAGNTSGSVTLAAPDVAGSTTLNLPIVSGGTLVTSDSSGNVGIGTNTAGGKFAVVTGSSAANSVTSWANYAVFGANAASSTGAGIGLSYNTSADQAELIAIAPNVAWKPLVLLGGGIRFNANNGGESMRIDTSGNVLVGTTDSSLTSGNGLKYLPGTIQFGQVISGTVNTFAIYNTTAGAYRFFVNQAGQINATSTSITAISDESLKENIRDLDTGLEAVMALKPRRFDWKEETAIGEKNVAGFIAQEVENVLPELVYNYQYNADETKKALKMGDILPTLVKAIQELKAELDTVKTELAALKGTA